MLKLIGADEEPLHASPYGDGLKVEVRSPDPWEPAETYIDREGARQLRDYLIGLDLGD